MKKKFVQIAALCLSAALIAAAGGRQTASATPSGASSGKVIRVGLHHDGPSGTGALEGLNLENEVGTGFSFGYYDSSNRFVLLGATDRTAISVVKTENVYYGYHNGYRSYHSQAASSDVAVGKYYLHLPETYPSFAKARKAAAEYEGGFPAYIGGEYYVRIGSYTTRNEAAATQAALERDGVETEVVTSDYGVNVVITSKSTIVFQYDDLGKGTGLGVEPNAADIWEDDEEDNGEDNTGDGAEDNGENDGPDDGEDGVEELAAVSVEDGVKYTTWSYYCLYYGGFRFERINGGHMTVVNILGLEDYVKGVVPHEMSESWHIEALKAQAVAARSYALSLGTKHSADHFDICDNVHCQAYSGQTRAGRNSDAAVDLTAGEVVLYNNKVAETFYYSSNGGASESSSVVWGSPQTNYPYLVGKVDPYDAESGANNNYTRTISSTELAAGLKKQGFNGVGSSIVSVAITSLTNSGNPKQVTFTDNKGKQFTVDSRYVRSIVGLPSFRYGLEAAGVSAPGVSVNGAPPVDADRLYAIDGNGKVTSVPGNVYVITGSGTVRLEQGGSENTGGIGSLGSTTGNNGVFTFVGKGWGHNVGMSQYGAKVMAERGHNYLEILQFYYTDITVGHM